MKVTCTLYIVMWRNVDMLMYTLYMYKGKGRLKVPFSLLHSLTLFRSFYVKRLNSWSTWSAIIRTSPSMPGRTLTSRRSWRNSMSHHRHRVWPVATRRRRWAGCTNTPYSWRDNSDTIWQEIVSGSPESDNTKNRSTLDNTYSIRKSEW